MKARFFSPLIDAIFHPGENIKPKLHYTRLEIHALIAINLEPGERTDLEISISIFKNRDLTLIPETILTLIPNIYPSHSSLYLNRTITLQRPFNYLE